jgi:hypothetical protein
MIRKSKTVSFSDFMLARHKHVRAKRISGFADIGSQADQRQFKAAVWGFAAELETNRKPLQMMPAHSRARFSYKQGQALVVQSLVSRKTHRKKPMVHGKVGTNARTVPFNSIIERKAAREAQPAKPGSTKDWVDSGYDDKMLRHRKPGWAVGDPLASPHWITALRAILSQIRDKPFNGLTRFADALGSDAKALFFVKQFLDRCWNPTTATRSAAAVDHERAPGTTLDGFNSAWEKPYDPPAP